MWGVEPSTRWGWAELKDKIAEHGMRNSLLMAPMPTASTAQILGNNESTEPFTSNMYNRRVLAGEFTVVNKHLLRELTSNGLWTEKVRNKIIADGGSVQNVAEIPKSIRDVYKTVWEIPQRAILDMAADRGAFICQSQSMNVHIGEPNTSKLTSMHFYAWKRGLKTVCITSELDLRPMLFSSLSIKKCSARGIVKDVAHDERVNHIRLTLLITNKSTYTHPQP